MLIVIASDTHRKSERLLELESLYPHASLFVHAGDWVSDPARYDHWISVAGNNDTAWLDVLEKERIVLAEGHRIYLCHGDRFAPGKRKEKLARLALENRCSIAVYGHSHVPDIDRMQGILLINPGSLCRNRNGARPSYALLHIYPEGCRAEIKFLP